MLYTENSSNNDDNSAGDFVLPANALDDDSVDYSLSRWLSVESMDDPFQGLFD